MAVVQLVEHQIVALVVVDSSSTGHPIIKADTANYYFYKTLIFGLRESLINICLVYKKNSEEMEMTSTELEILTIENRIALLQGRTGKENGKIVKKQMRRLRRLRDSK